MALLPWPYLDGPTSMALHTMALLTRVRPSIQLTEPIKVLNQERSQSATNSANKKAKELELVYVKY